MSSVRKLEWISIDDYLAGEEVAEVRHEYVAGGVYAMVGSTARHNRISGALFARLRAHLAGSSCEAFVTDIKVRVDDAFYYPDVVVSCVPVDPTAVYLTEPTLIAEVLSDSTEGRDRMEKWIAYRSLASLQEYLLIAQDEPRLEALRRRGDGWEQAVFGADDVVELESVGLSFPLQDLHTVPATG
ncbi:MAG: Uma2 family endonuclease [Salinisphaera sp.]|nr:Uma2 family endonuclease [Salinisphaera sp.]